MSSDSSTFGKGFLFFFFFNILKKEWLTDSCFEMKSLVFKQQETLW